MTYWTLDPPRQWRAGFTGEGENQKPFFFGCADCDAKDPEIAGFIGAGPNINQVGVIGGSFPFKLAMFCQACLDKRMAKLNL